MCVEEYVMFLRFVVIALIAGSLTATTAAAGPKGCPPGSAKKSLPCVPPGQAKSGRSARPCREGSTTSSWTRTPGEASACATLGRSRYVMVDNQVLRMNQATREVIEAVAAVSRALSW